MTTLNHIDNLAFAKKNDRLQATLSLTDFSRLCDLLGNTESLQADRQSNYIRYDLQGFAQGSSQYYLALTVEARLTGICQRCITAMPISLDLSFNYLLADVALDHVESTDDIDLLEIEPAMDVLALIEDELIAALPISPTHPDGCALTNYERGEKPNPFATLKGLFSQK